MTVPEVDDPAEPTDPVADDDVSPVDPGGGDIELRRPTVPVADPVPAIADPVSPADPVAVHELTPLIPVAVTGRVAAPALDRDPAPTGYSAAPSQPSRLTDAPTSARPVREASVARLAPYLALLDRLAWSTPVRVVTPLQAPTKAFLDDDRDPI